MIRSVKIIVLIALMILGVGKAVTLGSIWNSRANPKAGVEVVLKDGTVLRGALSREWTGNYSIHQSGSAVAVFAPNDFQRMTSPLPTAESSPSWFASWRAYSPAVFVIALFAALMLSFSARGRAFRGARSW